MKSRCVLFVAVLLLAAVVVTSTASAAKWEPYQFKGNEKYEYKISTKDGSTLKEAFYGLEIKKSAKGGDAYEVTYTTRGEIAADELGAETAFGLWSVYGMSLGMAFINPAYSFFFTQLDLAVGGNMNFYGAGTVNVTAKETVGGREGFVCKLIQTAEGANELLTEWTIDPALALPIKSILYDDGEVQSKIELIKYTKF